MSIPKTLLDTDILSLLMRSHSQVVVRVQDYLVEHTGRCDGAGMDILSQLTLVELALGIIYSLLGIGVTIAGFASWSHSRRRDASQQPGEMNYHFRFLLSCFS